MLRHIFHRLLLTLPALWLVLTMVFLLIHIVPGDPVEQMLGDGAAPGQVEQLRHTLGLDQPLLVQYGRYLGQIFRGDLGQSFKFQAPVRRIIFERYPATLQLAFLALMVCVTIAIPAGILAAYRRGSLGDRAISVFTLLGLAVPNFALGPLLITLFSIKLGWLPVSGRGGALNYILPAATLGAALAAILTRMVRGAMLEELTSDYVRTALHRQSPHPPCLAQRSHPHHYDSWLAVRYAFGRHHCHRDDFFLARHRSAHGSRHFLSRLSTSPGVHLGHRPLLRFG
jgi:ABC-type dipeptide/oligopeptide/nickel transport system permease component